MAAFYRIAGVCQKFWKKRLPFRSGGIQNFQYHLSADGTLFCKIGNDRIFAVKRFDNTAIPDTEILRQKFCNETGSRFIFSACTAIRTRNIPAGLLTGRKNLATFAAEKEYHVYMFLLLSGSSLKRLQNTLGGGDPAFSRIGFHRTADSSGKTFEHGFKNVMHFPAGKQFDVQV